MSYQNKASKVGKIKRKAYRLHQTVSRNDVCDLEELPKSYSGLQGNVSFNPITSNIFKNVPIPLETLKQKLPTYSKKDETNFEIKKAITDNQNICDIKGRRKKIPFHEVVASAKEFLKKREMKKKKEKAHILNDLQALQAALPSLEEKNQKKDKPRTAKPFSKQNSEMMEDLQAYHQCLARSDFESDPFSVITSILTQHVLKS